MKLYNRKEVSAILKKATQNSSTIDPDNQIGLSIDELRQLAKDVGMDPYQIEKAAAEIETDSKRIKSNFWGGPFAYSNQVQVDGEITVAQWEEMLISIRDFFQFNGNVTTRDSVFEWSSPWGTTNSAHVTALKSKGKTKISIGWNGPLSGIPFYIPVPLVALASLFFVSEFLGLTAIPGLGLTLFATGLTFLVGRWGLRRHLKKGFKKLQELVSSLENITNKKNSHTVLDSEKKGKHEPHTTKKEPLLIIDEEEKLNEEIIESIHSKRSKN